MKAILRIGFIALAIMALAVPADAGPFEDGKAAYEWGDYEASLKFLRPLAEQGHAESQYYLGQMSHSNLEAVKWFQKAAEQGHADAQFLLGVMHRYNHPGIPIDYVEGAKWFRMAAEQGHADAQVQLGYLLSLGFSVGPAQDIAESKKWLRMAAEQGNVWGQAHLAFLLTQDPQDLPEGLKWGQKAAEQGDTLSQLQLGQVYAEGWGDLIPKDYLLAHMWLNLARLSGEELASFEIDELEKKMTADQIADAQRMAREWIAEEGHTETKFNIGSNYTVDPDSQQDFAEGLKLIRMAAEQGHAQAQSWLGEMYEDGEGVPQDKLLAHMWFHIGASSGDEEARSLRDKLAKQMTPDQIADAQRMAREWMAKHRQSSTSFSKIPRPRPNSQQPSSS